ncbi:MAG: conjugal transfer protein TraX [Clostridia bacterium]|nr:conjugal transfer protein TraX [Clostridia bacterium]
MTSFGLKMIAMVTMLIDHIGFAAFHYVTWMNLLGRIAFPIFAFQISEGYVHTKNLKKYIGRLFVFALASQPAFMLFHSLVSKEIALNIFFTLFVGLVAIIVYDKITQRQTSLCKNGTLDKMIKHSLAIFVVILLGIFAQICKFDYGFFGIMIIFLFYLFKSNKMAMIISFIIACTLKYSINILRFGYHFYYILLCIFTVLPIIFICLYNQKQGRKIKYLLYFFYPVHLLILYFIFR